jgi:hypothetical protein
MSQSPCVPQTLSVTLNLFQGPLCHTARKVRAEEWMLKQVQHDDVGEGRA